MGKTLLHRLFGVGKLPSSARPQLEQEGIVLIDEGIGGSVTMKNFKAPGKRFLHRRTWFTGSLVFTGQRFAAFQYSKPLVNVPLHDDRLGQLDCSVEGEGTLVIAFDPSHFNPEMSGSIVCRYKTPQARLFLERIQAEVTR